MKRFTLTRQLGSIGPSCQAILPAVMLLIILAAPARGNLNYYGIEDTINEDLSVENKIVLQFDEPIAHLDYGVNFDISNLESSATFTSADCEARERVISCDFVGMTPEKNQLTLTFNTQSVVKEVDGRLKFNANYGFLQTNRTFVLIKLPQYSILSEDIANKSFSPPEGKIISDGKTIAVFWEMENIPEGNLQFSVSYFPGPEIPTFLVIGLTVIIIIVMVGVVVYARRRQQPAQVIETVLNQDEKTIVDILKQKEGKALQKALVKESGFSKAKISRIVKDMKERGIVNIEPVSGRENRIILTMGKKEEAKEPAQGEKPSQES